MGPDDFQTISQAVGEDPTAFDFILVCDGSGNSFTDPAGYYFVGFDRQAGLAHEGFGLESNGTNNSAELAPIVLGFNWIANQPIKGPTRVLVISDSEITVKGGRREYQRNANRHLWASVDYFEKELAWKIVWRHIPRNSHALHSRADTMSKAARKAAVELRSLLTFIPSRERSEPCLVQN